MASHELERFFELVLASPDLQTELRAITGMDAFIERAIAINRAAGGNLTAADLQAAANQRRREWLERGLQ